MNCSLKLKLKTATKAIVYMALEMCLLFLGCLNQWNYLYTCKNLGIKEAFTVQVKLKFTFRSKTTIVLWCELFRSATVLSLSHAHTENGRPFRSQTVLHEVSN